MPIEFFLILRPFFIFGMRRHSAKIHLNFKKLKNLSRATNGIVKLTAPPITQLRSFLSTKMFRGDILLKY